MTDLLREFAGGYLYQDYEEEFGGFEEALATFLAQLDASELAAFQNELGNLLQNHKTEESLSDALDELEWDDRAENGSAREIVQTVLNVATDHHPN